jgi:hypothetical protein
MTLISATNAGIPCRHSSSVSAPSRKFRNFADQIAHRPFSAEVFKDATGGVGLGSDDVDGSTLALHRDHDLLSRRADYPISHLLVNGELVHQMR